MKRITIIAVLMIAALQSFGAVRLPAVLSDGMVLQRNEPIKVWGWAGCNEKFDIFWNGKKVHVTASSDGTWEAVLPEMRAGGPYTMIIGDIELNDILVGDVFLCSGQSNMELPVRRVTDMFAEEISGYENNFIRHYAVPQTFDFNKERNDTPSASWKPCTQENVMEFSALAYFFAKELHRKTKVPVGLVNASWGGTPVEAWMSEDALKAFPKYINEKRLYEDEGYLQRIKQLEGENFHRWNTALDHGDPGLAGDIKWYSPDLDDNGWKTVEIFSKEWGNYGLNPVGGSHWLRKDIEIPAMMAGKEAIIRMGCIVDADSVYVNGHFVGNTTYQYPPRIYRIPAGVLKAGVNNVTVRVISNGGQPSFVPEKPYKIICGTEEISLEGTWKYKLGSPMPQAPSMMFFFYKPVCLYNAMISPLRNMKFQGVLWYQGESNVDRRNEYAALLGTMIRNWRDTFKDNDLPFYIVELADFLHKEDKEGRKAWQQMRDEQAKVTDTVTGTELIKNKDLGEWNDIHPLDKKTLGKRVCKAALKDIKKQLKR